jgi:hypothetical protein
MLAALADVEARMIAVLVDLDVTHPGITTRGLAAVGAIAVLGEPSEACARRVLRCEPDGTLPDSRAWKWRESASHNRRPQADCRTSGRVPRSHPSPRLRFGACGYVGRTRFGEAGPLP